MLSPQDFKEKYKKESGIVIDVRTRNEYNSGHIKDTDYNIDVSSSDFYEKLKPLDKDKTYYLYCRSGARSGRAAKLMEREGFENVYNIGGLQSLINAGFEKK